MKIDVVKVAKLANLPLIKEEEAKYSKQLSQILEYMEKLNQVDQVDTPGVEATFNVTGLSNVMREDETESCELIKKGFYKTKGVFNE